MEDFKIDFKIDNDILVGTNYHIIKPHPLI